MPDLIFSQYTYTIGTYLSNIAIHVVIYNMHVYNVYVTHKNI